jgi:hypothetical protein
LEEIERLVGIKGEWELLGSRMLEAEKDFLEKVRKKGGCLMRKQEYRNPHLACFDASNVSAGSSVRRCCHHD